ncbi:hypothetical protein BaRGS_00028918 [Batillaria attramentaria]|uniref:Uncharacterized protein n=1 Tax=Batillaria attramentaria TaxID=370345 RepID=A0ABD0JY64_9CAEN
MVCSGGESFTAGRRGLADDLLDLVGAVQSRSTKDRGRDVSLPSNPTSWRAKRAAGQAWVTRTRSAGSNVV